jgi:hypothetical protein
MGFRLGLEAKLYYGTAGATATNELTTVRDVTLNLEKGEADVTTRGSNGWRVTRGTLKDGSVEFELVWDTTDAGFVAIKNAFMNNTLIALAILDAESGSGLDADFEITAFSRSEPLEEALTVSVTAKPSYGTRYPTWI